MTRRRIAFVALTALAATLLVATPARAVDVVTCPGTEIVEFDPGLRLFAAQTVDMAVDGQFYTCGH